MPPARDEAGMPPAAQLEHSRRFLEIACELKLLSPDQARELALEVESGSVPASQLTLQRGLLTATQIDIVATLCAPRDAVPGYEALGLIGHGGMGVVYRARQLALSRLVALKTVQIGQLTEPAAVKRFEQEATLAARLAHPHIVTVFDFGRHAGRVFYAMELIEGEDADRLVRRAGPLEEALAWSIVRQAAAGLAHAQELAIVHRDIKPANLLLVQPPAGFPLPPGVPLVKIADFGLARLTQDEQQRTRLTADASAVGSLLYMAPEQLEAEATDARADIYALGATAYHLLAGQPPLATKTPPQIMAAKLTGKIPDPRDLMPQLSADSAELVLMLMALDPGRRPASYADVIARIDRLPAKCAASSAGGWLPPARPLQAAVHSAQTGTAPALAAPTVALTSAAPRRSRRTAIVVAVGAIVALLLAIGLAWIFIRPPAIERDLVPTGRGQYLFDGQQIDQWLPLSGGWFPQADEEGGLVLEGTGNVRRQIALSGAVGRPELLTHYRLILFVYLREAEAVEVQFDLANTERDAPRQLVRITPEGSRLGRRDGENAAPRFTSELVPLAVAAERPHVVQIERHSTGWWVFVDEQPIGAVRGTSAAPAAEFRVRAHGGAIWISDVTVEELARPPTQ
jgi:serine/threonine-protein kinase